MDNFRFISKEKIERSNFSSEWIKIDLPATTHVFLKDEKLYLKRIETETKVVWRFFDGGGGWLTIMSDNFTYLEHLENIYKKHLYNLREIKLKKILYEN